jgi:L-cystine uptake protein TcyP (sodium:dicarboxylate symporter family)
MGSGLSYNEKLDWGNKPLPAKYVKLYGMLVLLLIGAYLWKFHQHHSSILSQAALAALAIGVVFLLAIRWTKDDKISKSLAWIIVAQCVAQAIGLFRSW